MELNYDSSSSSSSEDELNEYLLIEFIEENRELEVVEDAIRYFVNSTAERDRSHGLRQRKKRTYVLRDRESANERLVADDFCNQPLYNERQFRRRFHMRKHVVIRIVDTLSVHDCFFQ